MIGATILSGEPCDTFNIMDYNVSTSTVELKLESENCDDTGTDVPGQGNIRTTRFNVPRAQIPMDGFRPGENRLQAPDGKDFYY